MINRIVLVTKKTRLDNMILENNREDVVKFVLETNGQSIESYKLEDTAYKMAISTIKSQIPNDIQLATVERDALPNFLFRETDLIIACGPDGLFANVAKYLEGQEILTVNPDPSTVAGVLMLHNPNSMSKILGHIKNGNYKTESLPFIKATIDNRNVVWGINDIFIGRKDQISSRYKISFGGSSESQSSSGVIVSTGVGATGWIKSIQTMLRALTGSGGKLNYLPSATSEQLVFVVREPFPSPSTRASIVTGEIVKGKPLSITCEMVGGYIFSDGMIEESTVWNAGSTVVLTVGDRYAKRIVL